MPLCEDANASPSRSVEIYSCLGGTDPPDPRVEGTAWIQINANCDIDGTGHTIDIVGHGVGGSLEGQKLTATEILALCAKTAIPYEFLGLTGPKSIVYAEIKSKDKDR